jgi:Tfp pilus assembly protein PilZ
MLERRHSDRFEIPGARVNYYVNDGEEIQMPLKNITHGGICFEIMYPLELGELVEVDIKLPGNNEIFVKGNVVWTTELAAAVQFLPFGTDERYNSFKSYQQIKEVLTEHIKVA